MKISELETDKALDVICDITPQVKFIAVDADIQERLKDLAKLREDLKSESKTVAQIVTSCLEAVCDFIPVIFRNHRQELYFILSRVNGIPAKDLEIMKLADTLKLAKDLIKDRAFIDLFT